MRTSRQGIELIKRHEGFRSKAYRCPAGVWTIGYGHTSGVRNGDVITTEQGERFLSDDLRNAENAITEQRLQLNQQQFDALVSFIYNVGRGNFAHSTLLRKVKANANDSTIRAEFLKWNKARVRGKLTALPGLTKRRYEEANLYFSK